MKPALGQIVATSLAGLDPQLGTEPKVGIVLARRWRDCRVLFIDLRRTFWLAHHDLRPPDGPIPHTVALTSALSHRLAADVLEIGDGLPRRLSLQLHHPGIELTDLDALRERIGPALVSWRIGPSGMRRVLSELAIDLEAWGERDPTELANPTQGVGSTSASSPST